MSDNETKRRYRGDLTFGRLDIALESHEILFGGLTKLESWQGFTVATYTFDENNFPAASTLALMPLIGGETPPAPDGGSHLFNGKAVVIGIEMDVAVYRTG